MRRGFGYGGAGAIWRWTCLVIGAGAGLPQASYGIGDAIVATVGDGIIFESQVDPPPGPLPCVWLPPVLTARGNREVIDVLTDRAILLQESLRLGVAPPSLLEVRSVTRDCLDGEENSPPGTSCLSHDAMLLRVREDVLLNKVVDEKFRPFVRVRNEDVANAAGDLNVPWMQLSPLERDAVFEALREDVFRDYLNRRVEKWLEENRLRVRIRQFTSK